MAALPKMKSGGGAPSTAPTVFSRFRRLTGWMNAVGTVWIFLLMLLVNADIAGREFFGAPVRGTTELVGLSIVGIVFLQLAHTLAVGRLTRSDAFLGVLTARFPRTAAALRGLFHLTGAVMMLVLAYASYPYLRNALAIGDYVGAIGDFTAPTWPVRLIILSGSAVTAIQFLLLAVLDAKAAAAPSRQPS